MKARQTLVFAATVTFTALCGAQQQASSTAPLTNDCTTGHGKCRVDVTVTEPCIAAGNIKVDPVTLQLAGKRNQKIEWQLIGNYAFCDTTQDAAMFKDGGLDFQFSNPSYGPPTGPGSRCSTSFSWMDKNDGWTKGKEYSYFLKFTGPNGSCYFDPFIKNG